MNRMVKVWAASAALAASFSAFAEDLEDDASDRSLGWTPVAVGIASPVQVPWGHAVWDLRGLNLGILYSGLGKVTGLSVAGLATYAKDDVKALEISGLANINCRDVYGWTTTLGASICKGTVNGVDIGLFGYRRSLWGLDIQGLGSIQDDVNGVQIGGLANVVRERSFGWNVSLGVNMSKVAYGWQLAGIFNMADELHGCQVGIVNYAKECPWGFQIGVVNIIMDNALKVLPLINFYF